MLTKNSLQLTNSLSYLSYDLTSAIGSVCVPKTSLKKLPERMIIVKGYLAEVNITQSNNPEKYQVNHSTFFIKLFHQMSLIDEIKMFVKVYPEKLEMFNNTMQLGRLVEIRNVKQYFSNELNFVFRSNYAPDQYTISSEEVIESSLTFKQRLRQVSAREPIPITNISLLPPMSVVRNCIKVGIL